MGLYVWLLVWVGVGAVTLLGIQHLLVNNTWDS